MSNLRRSIVGPLDVLGPNFVGARGFHLHASDGRMITLLRAQILSHFLSETGGLAGRRLRTRQWIRDQILAAIGQDQVDGAGITCDFSDDDGELTSLEMT